MGRGDDGVDLPGFERVDWTVQGIGVQVRRLFRQKIPRSGRLPNDFKYSVNPLHDLAWSCNLLSRDQDAATRGAPRENSLGLYPRVYRDASDFEPLSGFADAEHLALIRCWASGGHEPLQRRGQRVRGSRHSVGVQCGCRFDRGGHDALHFIGMIFDEALGDRRQCRPNREGLLGALEGVGQVLRHAVVPGLYRVRSVYCELYNLYSYYLLGRHKRTGDLKRYTRKNSIAEFRFRPLFSSLTFPVHPIGTYRQLQELEGYFVCH